METRTLGTNGPALSVVGLGCNMFGPKLDLEASQSVIHAAIDAGIKGAHDDPQNFELPKFAGSLKKLLKKLK